jgi:HEAT repeats
MITATVSLVLLLVLPAGALHCSHDKVPGECTVCAEETSAVHEQITRLESCSGWMARRRAARALRKYDWKCHPEAADALAGALMNDDCGLVRQEAAESLARMRPCLAVVHEAVARAAKRDASLLTRCSAKKALKSLGKACVEPCAICGPGNPVEGDDALPLVPRSEPLPMDSRIEPLPPAQMIVPDNSSEGSPFSPGVSPPLPSLAPGSTSLLRPGPARGPVLEDPSLNAPFALPGPRPNLVGPLSGRGD